jgi:hypothetical protein
MDMKLHDSDREWEKEAPTLATMEKVNPFAVPSKYFDSLSETLHSISLIESVRFENEEEFSTPKGYFKELEKHIKTKAALENSQELLKTSGFNTPEDYFSDLSQKIEAKIKQQDISRKKSIFKSWISYSAAACITMIIGSVVYFNLKSDSISRDLSNIPDQEIINYLQIHSTVSDNLVIIENLSDDGLQQVSNDVSAEEIEQYINNNTL